MESKLAAIALLALLLLLSGAGCRSPQAPLACPDSQVPRNAKIFYATDRRPLSAGTGLEFGRERTAPPGLHMGWERVALGPNHQLGKMDAAITITREHERTETPGGGRAGALGRSDAEIAAFVETQLRPAIRLAPPPRRGGPRQVFFFVHGFRTTFDEGVLKTAQLAADLGLVTCDGQMRGVAVAYSWPAQGKLLSYLADEENAEWTQQRLAPFLHSLSRICRKEGARLHLVAHSMGARALVRSLADLANSGEWDTSRVRLADQVILLAPDIGEGLFDQYAERILPVVGHMTVYVSAKDRALSLSTLLHGGHRRLGLLESTVLAALELTGIRRGGHLELAAGTAGTPGSRVDIIDVSGSPATQYGHTYEGPRFIRDLSALIFHNTPAGEGTRSHLLRCDVRSGVFRSLGGSQLHYFRLPRPGSNR